MVDSRTSLIGFLKQTHSQKRVYFQIQKSKHSLYLLEELRNSLMIYGYTLESKYSKVIVYLNYYRNRPALKHIRIESRPGHRRYLTVRSTSRKFNKHGNAGVVAFTQNSYNKKVNSVRNEDFKSKTSQYSKSFGELLCVLW